MAVNNFFRQIREPEPTFRACFLPRKIQGVAMRTKLKFVFHFVAGFKGLEEEKRPVDRDACAREAKKNSPESRRTVFEDAQRSWGLFNNQLDYIRLLGRPQVEEVNSGCECQFRKIHFHTAAARVEQVVSYFECSSARIRHE
jgi:hypothetical protein